jgi:hypothetical protein
LRLDAWPRRRLLRLLLRLRLSHLFPRLLLLRLLHLLLQGLNLLSKLVDLLLVLPLQGLHLLLVLLLHYLHLLLELVDQAVELGGTLRRRRMHDERRGGDQRTAPQSPPQDCHSSSYGLRRARPGSPSLSHYAG